MNKIKYTNSQQTLTQFCDKNLAFRYLLDEFDVEKNNLQPNEISCNKKEKVWWICQKCNHQWLSTISNRIVPHGCPSCRACPQTSFTEKTIYYYIKKAFPDSLPGYKPKWLKGKEIDVYIPSLNIGIEYDGQHWHQDVNRDLQKDIICDENDVILIRIREPGCPKYDSCSIKYASPPPNNDYSHLASCLTFILKYIRDYYVKYNDIDFDIDRDYAEIKELFNRTIKEKSLAYSFPDIATEWHPTKNKSRTPMLVSAGSNQKAWWLGKCGHEWETRISHRTNGSNCPYCSNQRLLVGFNDLITRNSEIAAEWYYEKNYPIKPDQVIIGSNHVYWWKCKNGHEWSVSVNRRVSKKGYNCPYCSGHRVWPGFNDIGTTHAYLLDEWDYEKNVKLPSEISKCSYYEAYWIGKQCKHKYQMKVSLKTSGCACPYCSNKRVLKGYNDLATTHPEWLILFDYNKNSFSPNEIVAGTSKSIWWLCKNGHSYERNGNKMLRSTKCPYCK